jgi:outer membrane protein assembly factor BamB
MSITTKEIVAIITTIIVVSILSSSLLLVNAQTSIINGSTENNNYMPSMGQTNYNSQYSSPDKSAYASAYSKWGDPLNEAYACGNPVFSNGARTCFVDGPAPDRPDVLWTTGDQLMGYTGRNYSYPTIASWSSAPLAIAGQIIGSASIRLPNNTAISCLTSLNPITGTINWYTKYPVIPRQNFNLPHSGGNTSDTLSLPNTGFGFAQIDKVDDTHILVGYNQMWRTDGTFLWYDRMISASDTYHVYICAAAPAYRLFGGSGTSPGQRVTLGHGWDLSDPEVNKDIYNASDPIQQVASGRSLWNYTLDETGDVEMCYDADDDILIRGSYASAAVFAQNGTTGEKLWETFLPTATGYSGCYANGRIYVGCQATAETCLNATTGAIIWRNADGEANRAFNVWNVMYAYGRVYYHDLGTGRTGSEKCYDALTGQKLWASTSLFSIGYYTTKVADGKVFGNQADGSTTTGRQADPVAFCCWDAFTGEIIWKLRASYNCPVIAYGGLYIVSSSCLICISTCQPAQDWTEWRGNTEFPGITMDDGPRDFSYGPVWTYQMGAGTQSSPVVVEGKVYIGSNDRNIYCLDAYNGTEIWKFRTNEPRMTHYGSTCAVYSGVVITGADDGHVYGLDANTGAQKWVVDAGPYIAVRISAGQFEVRSSPIIANGHVYIGSSHNNKTYCIEPLSGVVKWSTDIGSNILGSAAIANGSLYMVTLANRMYKINANPDPSQGGGTIQLNMTLSGSSSVVAYTPTVSFDYGTVYYGAVGNQVYAFNTTTGIEITPRFSTQPHVLSETSCGALILVPGNMLSAINQTLSSPTMNNGTVWSGYPLTYENNTSANPLVTATRSVPGYTYYKGQYTFGSDVTKLIGQAGPTIFCAPTADVNVTIASGSLPPGATSAQVNPLRLARAGDNIWSDWGGWEVWSSPILASFGTNALVYYGSESFAVHCVNASNGVPLTWWTTHGPMGASQAICDGKLYAASLGGMVYCFEEHITTQTTTTAAVDTTSANQGQTVTVTAKLTSVPTLNPYEELGMAAPVPSIPNQTLTVTFIKPDGTSTVDVPATTDEYGNAVVQYTPDVAGNWQVVAAYNGMMGPRETYAKSASDVIGLSVGGSSATATPVESSTPSATVTPTPVVTEAPTATPTSTISGGADNTLLYAGIAVVVIIVIVLAALVLMRRKK